MADGGASFSDFDTPHGLAKRRLVKGYCGGLFGRELESAKFERTCLGDKFRVAYVDAFCWRGECRVQHDGPGTRSQEDSDEDGDSDQEDQENDGDGGSDQEEDIARMGSPIIALDRGLDRIKIMAQNARNINLLQKFNAIHYVFNDISKENILNLMKLVFKMMAMYGWDGIATVTQTKYNLRVKEFLRGEKRKGEKDNKRDITFQWCLKSAFLEGSSWQIKTTFVIGKFEDLELPPASKTFSLLDPCGIKQIPFEAVKRFVGPGKEVFINLMVWTIRRSSANPNHSKSIQNLFGNPESDVVVKSFAKCHEKCTESNKMCCTKNAYKKYVKYYSESIAAVASSADAEAVHFLFSKGKKNKEAGDQFYMVYLSSDMDLQMVQKMKSSMVSVVQTEDGELRHTDYYALNGIKIPFGRKTSNEDEKTEIYRHFKDRSESLFEVKRWILVNSPFAFHSRALGLLEKEGLLHVDSSGDARRSGNFRANKFSEGLNNWRLSFHEVPTVGTRTRGMKRGPAALLRDVAPDLPATSAPAATPAPATSDPAAFPDSAPASAQKMKVTHETCRLCGQKEVGKKSIRAHERSAKCKRQTQLRAIPSPTLNP